MRQIAAVQRAQVGGAILQMVQDLQRNTQRIRGAVTTMAVAMGEEVANMLQPFWALPVVAIAGIGIQRVMGFTVLTFVVSTLIYGAALLLLV